MAYYWMTEAQVYIHQLGFGSSLPPINNEPQDARINQWGVDNSFETDHPKDELRFGKGGVDDAEDAEVILHEYGHAIHQSQGFNFAPEENGAISEGFGDYWAVTVSDVVSQALGVPEQEPLPCVTDWDATSYTSSRAHCLRRVDGTLHYPADLNGEVHHDGQIWSRALWDIRQALGHTREGRHDHPGRDERLHGHVDAGPGEPGRSRRRSSSTERRGGRRAAGVPQPRHLVVAKNWTCGPRPARPRFDFSRA